MVRYCRVLYTNYASQITREHKNEMWPSSKKKYWLGSVLLVWGEEYIDRKGRKETRCNIRAGGSSWRFPINHASPVSAKPISCCSSWRGWQAADISPSASSVSSTSDVDFIPTLSHSPRSLLLFPEFPVSLLFGNTYHKSGSVLGIVLFSRVPPFLTTHNTNSNNNSYLVTLRDCLVGLEVSVSDSWSWGQGSNPGTSTNLNVD